VEAATLPPTDGWGLVSRLFSPLSSIVVFRACAVFPPAFEIAALPRTVPTFLQLDEDERKKDTVQGFCACIVVVVVVVIV